MALTIDLGDPASPDAMALLTASHQLMTSLFSAESNHFLSIDALKTPQIRFFVAHDGGPALGCCALADKGDYGEVKSMFVDPAARGKGVGAALMARIEAEARAAGLAALKLETGTKLTAAHRVYARAGFSSCGPFGDYEEHPESLYMSKPLG